MQNCTIRRSSQVDVCSRFQETRVVRTSDQKIKRSCNSQSVPNHLWLSNFQRIAAFDYDQRLKKETSNCLIFLHECNRFRNNTGECYWLTMQCSNGSSGTRHPCRRVHWNELLPRACRFCRLHPDREVAARESWTQWQKEPNHLLSAVLQVWKQKHLSCS